MRSGTGGVLWEIGGGNRVLNLGFLRIRLCWPLKLTMSQVNVGDPRTLIPGICRPTVAEAARGQHQAREALSRSSKATAGGGCPRLGLVWAPASGTELEEGPPPLLPRAGLCKVAPTQLCGLGAVVPSARRPLGASGRGRALRRAGRGREGHRGERARGPGRASAVVTPRSDAAEPATRPRSPQPQKHLPGRQP